MTTIGPPRWRDVPGILARLAWFEFRRWRTRRRLDPFVTMPSIARRHAPGCKAIYDPFTRCEPDCETDAQLRARIRAKIKAPES